MSECRWVWSIVDECCMRINVAFIQNTSDHSPAMPPPLLHLVCVHRGNAGTVVRETPHEVILVVGPGQ